MKNETASAFSTMNITRTEESILQFLLQISYWQDFFYSPTTPYPAISGVPESATISTIQIQAKAQINFLINAISSLGFITIAPPLASFYDFSAKTISNTIGTYPDFSTNYTTFLSVSQLIEDTSARAYLGQIQYLVGNKAIIGQISGFMSIHARKAAFFRKVISLLGVLQGNTSPGNLPLKPWITGEGNDASGYPVNNIIGASPLIYNGESNAIQSQINIVGLNNNASITLDVATESFDQPLSSEDTLNIVNSFLALPPVLAP